MYIHLLCTSDTNATNLNSYAEKSAAPVAALVASLFNVAPHTAPLWPLNVPIQSPVSPCRSMGLPSVINTRYCSVKFHLFVMNNLTIIYLAKYRPHLFLKSA